MIYLDNAATTLHKPAVVAEAVLAAMSSLGNPGRGSHEATLSASRTIYETRRILAGFFNAGSPSRIAFACNSTEALNTAIKGTLSAGDHAVTTVMEHNSVLRPLYELEEKGVSVSYAGCDEKGRLLTEELESLIRPETRALICTHGSNLTGNVNDLAALGRIARRHGLLLIVDASQTAGIFPIDVQACGIDILCFTGHKSLLGPQGTGGLYVRPGVSVRPLKSGGTGIQTYSRAQPADMPTLLEAGTLNGHGLAGLGAAVSWIRGTGIDILREKALRLMRLFYEGVRDIPGIVFYGDYGTELRCPIVTLNLAGADSGEISDILSTDYGICTRPGGHCAPLMHRALGTADRGAVRFSFSSGNTDEETKQAIEAVREIAADVCATCK